MRRSTRAGGYERLAAEQPDMVHDHKPLQWPWKAQCGCEEAMEGHGERSMMQGPGLQSDVQANSACAWRLSIATPTSASLTRF